MCPHSYSGASWSTCRQRALATGEGLDGSVAYMADLNQEIEICRHLYVCAAVTEIARLRAELSGPQEG